jgi:translation initiation factor 3 subunit I
LPYFHVSISISRLSSDDTKLLLTASADQTCKLWDVKTGKELFSFPHTGVVRGVAWAEGEREFLTVTDPFGLDRPASINVFVFAARPEDQDVKPRLTIVDDKAPKVKVTKAAWLPLNQGILAAYENGLIRILDPHVSRFTTGRRSHSHPPP